LPARVLLLALLCAAVLPSTAWAHASLVRSNPADGAVLAAAPTSVRLVFDDDVRAGSGMKAIRNGDGSVLAGNPHVVGGRVLVVPLRDGLGNGDYTVLWRVLSDDGHTIAGVIAFGVGTGRAPPTAGLSVSNGPTAEDVVSRVLFFAGLLTAVGAAVFRFFVGPVPVRLLLGAFLLVFVGVSGAIHDVSVSTRFGLVMAVTAVVAGVGALLAAIAPLYPRLERLAFVCALVILPAPSLAGHALDRGRSRVEVLADLVHVAAASVWLGGLVALALALRRGADGVVLRRFSNLAFVSVIALAATGVVRALSELGSVSQVWTTGYGRLLLVKTTLLGLLVVIGWVNRYRLVPRLSFEGLRLTVPLELVLFVGLVAAVAILTDVRPGRDRIAAAAAVASTAKGPPPLPAREMVVQAQEDGDFAVALAVHAPGAEVTVLDPDGNGVDGLAVDIAGTRARSCGPGCYGAFVQLARRMIVSVDGRRLVFRVPATLRPADPIVARATRVFRALRSVDFVERLASSPRNHVVADFTLERPDREEYRIRGGASGIIIGPRRWDRENAGRWFPSSQQPTSQPEPIWTGHVTNAYVLQATPREYVVSFLKRSSGSPAWFTLRLDRETFRPRDLRMTAAAHFMTHRYTRFNAPPKIKPPPR
jgi:copper transport protein